VSFQAAGSMLASSAAAAPEVDDRPPCSQGISAEFTGFVKIRTATILRSINLRHLPPPASASCCRTNFLFRGPSGQHHRRPPGLTMADAVRAAPAAGAEDFIERMPAATRRIIEEGSPTSFRAETTGAPRDRPRADHPDRRFSFSTSRPRGSIPERGAGQLRNILRIGRNRTRWIVSHRRRA